MCNFVIRPMKAYATVQVTGEGADKYKHVERGDTVQVVGVSSGRVEVVWKEETLYIDTEDYIRSFIVDPEEIKKVKEEEAKWFPKKKETKKDDKKS